MKKNSPLLYALILLTLVILAATGGMTFYSYTSLSSLQSQVSDMQKTVQGIQETSADLVEKAAELDHLRQQLAEATPSPTPTPAPTPSADLVSGSNAEAGSSAAPGAGAEPEQEQGLLSSSRNPDSIFSQGTDDKLNSLMEQLQFNLPAGNGQWAVYVSDLSTGAEGSLGNARMQAASLIKLYIMGAVYENFDSLSGQYGADHLNSNLYPMITVSDNDAANELVRCLGYGDQSQGMAVVNSFCQAHGYSASHMGRLLLAPNDYDDNYTSVEDCGRFMKEVYYGSNGGTNSTLSHCSEMFNLLSQQERTHKIPAALPDGVLTANKTGELGDVENDAAIVYQTAKGRDLVICFMSQGLSEPGSAQNAISSLSLSIYNYFNG